MILFGEGYFFMLLALFCVPAACLGIAGRNIKYYGFAVSLVMVALAVSEEPGNAISLILYCAWEFLLTYLFAAYSRRRPHRFRAYILCLILSLLPLLTWKLSAAAGHALFYCIGLSYLSFKTAQIVIEIYDGLIKDIRPFEFAYFLLFFPCISSGPIDRSRRFISDLRETPDRAGYLELLGDGLFQLIGGSLYKFLCAGAVYQAMMWLGRGDSPGSRLIYMYSYGLYLFFDFAGYSRMAVGASKIFGIRTPANFNSPFLAADMKDFWNRWHMTLSYWFRDYLFSRFMMHAIKGRWFRNRLSGAAVGLIVDMTVMGLWHGLSSNYIMYGLYHGLLLAVTEFYQKKSGFYRRHRKDRWYRTVSWFITMQLVFFGFFIFSGKFGSIIGLRW